MSVSFIAELSPVYCCLVLIMLLNHFELIFFQYNKDETLTCSSPPPSPTCSVTVSLSGHAKEIWGECEGQYMDTGLKSLGRQVEIHYNPIH